MDALHKLKQKLKSQTGASITFALLLFLVCAVVGSAVLVAGTAAAGRMSKIAEMDQRYYAVNSAASLLIKQIDGTDNTTTIVKQVDTPPGGSPGTPAYYYLDSSGDLKSYDPASINNVALLLAYQLAAAGSSSPLSITHRSDSKPYPLKVRTASAASGRHSLYHCSSR